MRPHSDLVSGCALVVFCSVVLILPHLLPWFPLPKSEDFEYTTIASTIHARQALSGMTPKWFWGAGLGSPWPLPLGLSHSPLGFLLAYLTPLTAVALIVFGHLILAGIAVLWLCERFSISKLVRPACILSAMFGVHVELLYSSDATTAFVGALWIPVILALMIHLLDGNSILRSCATAALLGIAGGLTIKEGHIGISASYAVGFIVFLLFQPYRTFKAAPYFLAAVLIALAVSYNQLAMLITEYRLYPADLIRLQDGAGGMTHALWGMFIRPFSRRWVESNMLVRTIGFGAVFAVVVCVLAARLYRTPETRPLLLAFWCCVGMIFLPVSMLPAGASAIWPIRDVANLLGILLAGAGLSSIALSHRRLTIALTTAQAALVLISAVPLIAGGELLTRRGIFTTGQYNALVDAANPTPFIRALKTAIGPGEDLSARFIATSQASQMMDQENLVDVGAVNNVSIAHGLAEVSFIAKGVSFDSIQRSQSKPYGAIVGDRYRQFELFAGANDWPRDDQDLLTLLGIKAVVAEAGEIVTAAGLRLQTTLKARDGFAISVYRNDRTLPSAFFVPASTLDEPLSKRPGCIHDVLVCYNVGPVVRAADISGISLETGKDEIRLNVSDASSARSILVTSMFRPRWTVMSGNAERISVQPWHGLMRVNIPAGTGSVVLRYE